MNSIRFSCLCVLMVGVASGCKKDATFQEPVPPQAALHWVNAVPDTGVLDIRPIDIITNAALMDAPFRGANQFYQGIEAGTRRIRAFLSSGDPVVTSVPILDTSITLAADNSYSLIYTGFARTGQTPSRAMWVVPDTPTPPGANQVGLRILHAGAGLGNIDINVTRRAADTLPDAPLVGNAAYNSASGYFAFVRDTLTADSLRVVVTAAGTKTPVLLSLRFPAGVVGDSVSNPIPGVRVAGSVLTAVIVPASVAGSGAPQGGAFAAPSAVFLTDLRPPNTVTPR